MTEIELTEDYNPEMLIIDLEVEAPELEYVEEF